MRLADFIDSNIPAILAEWELFAASLLPAADGLDAVALRNHAEQILQTISKDLRTSQTPSEQSARAKGLAPLLPGAGETAAQTHAVLRATAGFSIRQLVAEYRALRASVLRLWGEAAAWGPEAMEDVGRFNEAIDQAIAESIDHFTNEVERWRALFLGVLGHDLRNPLNSILLTAQLISAMSEDSALGEQSKKLLRSGERMRRLLDDLLDYNRASLNVGIRVVLQQVDLAKVCLDEIDLLRAALPESKVEFSVHGATEGQWDASRIRQVLSNLVVNAVKYGRKNTAVRVELRGEEQRALLRVVNDGPGIPKELMHSLFEPLRRQDVDESVPQRESLGLGLFIVRQIALAHGGAVDVESRDGRTCFTVSLPKGGEASVAT